MIKITKSFLGSCLSFLLLTSTLFAEQLLYGTDIKTQASEYFKNLGIDAEILVSDRRAFFHCNKQLVFVPKRGQDWRTVTVTCPNKNWEISLRTTASFFDSADKNYDKSVPTLMAVSLSKNMSKGEIIEESDLKIVRITKANSFAGFHDINELVGRKIKNTLASGTILKARHIDYHYSVKKDDTVIVILGNNKISVVNYGIALDSGQKGDLITIKNSNSNNTFKAVIIGEKKVAPLTNM